MGKNFICSDSLYAKDALNSLRVWTISLFEYEDGIFQLEIQHGVEGGDMQTQYETIEWGLASRSTLDQAKSRYNSRINKKIDSGYVFSKNAAMEKKRTNVLGMPKPMLAHKFKDMKQKINWNCPVFVQRKYNGHRCLISVQDGIVMAYSRGGKEIKTITEILNEVENLDLPNGTILDGELYLHGAKLQTISSYVKARKPETEKLTFICYDVIMNANYSKRHQFIKSLKLDDCTKHCKMAETEIVKDEVEALTMLNYFISCGYEGAILRQELGSYEDGKRSQRLIKMKKAMDAEFKIVDIRPSTEGWAVLDCVTKTGEPFKCSAPGTVEQKINILLEKEKYINTYVNISYFEESIRGVPMQLVANYFMIDVKI